MLGSRRQLTGRWLSARASEVDCSSRSSGQYRSWSHTDDCSTGSIDHIDCDLKVTISSAKKAAQAQVPLDTLVINPIETTSSDGYLAAELSAVELDSIEVCVVPEPGMQMKTASKYLPTVLPSTTNLQESAERAGFVGCESTSDVSYDSGEDSEVSVSDRMAERCAAKHDITDRGTTVPDRESLVADSEAVVPVTVSNTREFDGWSEIHLESNTEVDNTLRSGNEFMGLRMYNSATSEICDNVEVSQDLQSEVLVRSGGSVVSSRHVNSQTMDASVSVIGACRAQDLQVVTGADDYTNPDIEAENTRPVHAWADLPYLEVPQVLEHALSVEIGAAENTGENREAYFAMPTPIRPTHTARHGSGEMRWETLATGNQDDEEYTMPPGVQTDGLHKAHHDKRHINVSNLELYFDADVDVGEHLSGAWSDESNTVAVPDGIDLSDIDLKTLAVTPNGSALHTSTVWSPPTSDRELRKEAGGTDFFTSCLTGVWSDEEGVEYGRYRHEEDIEQDRVHGDIRGGCHSSHEALARSSVAHLETDEQEIEALGYISGVWSDEEVDHIEFEETRGASDIHITMTQSQSVVKETSGSIAQGIVCDRPNMAGTQLDTPLVQRSSSSKTVPQQAQSGEGPLNSALAEQSQVVMGSAQLNVSRRQNPKVYNPPLSLQSVLVQPNAFFANPKHTNRTALKGARHMYLEPSESGFQRISSPGDEQSSAKTATKDVQPNPSVSQRDGSKGSVVSVLNTRDAQAIRLRAWNMIQSYIRVRDASRLQMNQQDIAAYHSIVATGQEKQREHLRRGPEDAEREGSNSVSLSQTQSADCPPADTQPAVIAYRDHFRRDVTEQHRNESGQGGAISACTRSNSISIPEPKRNIFADEYSNRMETIQIGEKSRKRMAVAGHGAVITEQEEASYYIEGQVSVGDVVESRGSLPACGAQDGRMASDRIDASEVGSRKGGRGEVNVPESITDEGYRGNPKMADIDCPVAVSFAQKTADSTRPHAEGHINLRAGDVRPGQDRMVAKENSSLGKGNDGMASETKDQSLLFRQAKLTSAMIDNFSQYYNKPQDSEDDGTTMSVKSSSDTGAADGVVSNDISTQTFSSQSSIQQPDSKQHVSSGAHPNSLGYDIGWSVHGRYRESIGQFEGYTDTDEASNSSPGTIAVCANKEGRESDLNHLCETFQGMALADVASLEAVSERGRTPVHTYIKSGCLDAGPSKMSNRDSLFEIEQQVRTRPTHGIDRVVLADEVYGSAYQYPKLDATIREGDSQNRQKYTKRVISNQNYTGDPGAMDGIYAGVTICSSEDAERHMEAALTSKEGEQHTVSDDESLEGSPSLLRDYVAVDDELEINSDTQTGCSTAQFLDGYETTNLLERSAEAIMEAETATEQTQEYASDIVTQTRNGEEIYVRGGSIRYTKVSPGRAREVGINALADSSAELSAESEWASFGDANTQHEVFSQLPLCSYDTPPTPNMFETSPVVYAPIQHSVSVTEDSYAYAEQALGVRLEKGEKKDALAHVHLSDIDTSIRTQFDEAAQGRGPYDAARSMERAQRLLESSSAYINTTLFLQYDTPARVIGPQALSLTDDGLCSLLRERLRVNLGSHSTLNVRCEEATECAKSDNGRGYSIQVACATEYSRSTEGRVSTDRTDAVEVLFVCTNSELHHSGMGIHQMATICLDSQQIRWDRFGLEAPDVLNTKLSERVNDQKEGGISHIFWSSLSPDYSVSITPSTSFVVDDVTADVCASGHPITFSRRGVSYVAYEFQRAEFSSELDTLCGVTGSDGALCIAGLVVCVQPTGDDAVDHTDHAALGRQLQRLVVKCMARHEWEAHTQLFAPGRSINNIWVAKLSNMHGTPRQSFSTARNIAQTFGEMMAKHIHNSTNEGFRNSCGHLLQCNEGSEAQSIARLVWETLMLKDSNLLRM